MLNPPSGSWRSRMDRTALSMQRPRRRLPHSAHRRIQPQLEEDVIRFQRGIGRQLRAPVSVRAPADRPERRRPVQCPGRRAPGACLAISSRAHSSNRNHGQLRGQRKPHVFVHQLDLLHFAETVPRRNSINSCTRCSGAEAPAVTATFFTPSSQFVSTIVAIVHQVGAHARIFPHLYQALGIRAVLRAHHQQQVAAFAIPPSPPSAGFPWHSRCLAPAVLGSPGTAASAGP